LQFATNGRKDAGMDLTAKFIQMFEIPEMMQPYLHRIADEKEIQLVVALGDRELPSHEIAAILDLPPADTEALLARAVYRAVLKRRKRADCLTVYSTASFWLRLTYISIQDSDWWGSLPADVRDGALEWHLWENIRRHGLADKARILKQDPDLVEIHNRDILLLPEALAIVDAANLHVVVPCDCRTTVMRCDLPRLDTCLRLDWRGRNTLESGRGRVVSKEECRQIVIDANRAGLVHTGQRAEHGRPAILNGNCCPCCSYPFREGQALGLDKIWPRARYMARLDSARCDNCGICIERCPFNAFSIDCKGQLAFNAEKCHGCGLCATGCPRDAIGMVPIV
jgi:ferredoxin